MLKLSSSSPHNDRFQEWPAFATFFALNTLQTCLSGPCSQEAMFACLTAVKVSSSRPNYVCLLPCGLFYSHGGNAVDECAGHVAAWGTFGLVSSSSVADEFTSPVTWDKQTLGLRHVAVKETTDPVFSQAVPRLRSPVPLIGQEAISNDTQQALCWIRTCQ